MPENVEIKQQTVTDTHTETATPININSSSGSSSTTPPAPSLATPKTLSGSSFGQHREDIFKRLKANAEQCRLKYEGKRELATEHDEVVAEMCEAFEEVFSYGLKQQQAAVVVTAASILQNMQEIMTGNIGGPSVSSVLDSTFWDFCQMHLTPHERQRFENLPKIWTKYGRGKAFIRAALNENSLQRYLLQWLDDEEGILRRYYTSWSFFHNDETAKELPRIAGSLNQVLFALTIDATELNVATRFAHSHVAREEPIIEAPAPVPVLVSKHKRKTQLAIERPIATATSSENLATPTTVIATMATINQQNVHAFEEQLSVAVQCRRESLEDVPACDPIEPELAFLKEPLPDFYPTTAASPPLSTNSAAALEETQNSSLDLEYEDKSDSSSQYSKSSLSANGTIIQTVLEKQLQDTLDRCALLETRVAQLSLENRQLVRRLTQFFKDSGIDPSSSLSSNYLITIPQAKLIKSRPGTGSSYYTYEVHVTMRRQLEHWSVLRRYRDFHKLHKSLLRTHPSISSVEFPPKKRFGNMNLVFVEERRQQLQIYLINLVEMLPQVEACKTKAELQKVFPFLRER